MRHYESGFMDVHSTSYLHTPTSDELRAIRTTPGGTSEGIPFDWYVRKEVGRGELRLQCVRPSVLGLSRPVVQASSLQWPNWQAGCLPHSPPTAGRW